MIVFGFGWFDLVLVVSVLFSWAVCFKTGGVGDCCYDLCGFVVIWCV